MRRRQVVATLGLLAAGSAGCASTPSPEPQPPGSPPGGGGQTTPRAQMEVTDFEPLEGPDGNLVVEMTVRNPGTRTRETRVLVTARAGDTTRSATREATLAAGESLDLSVTIQLPYDDWERMDSSLDFAFSEQ